MEIKLFNYDYKRDEEFYKAFLEGTIQNSSYISDEICRIPEELPDFEIYFARSVYADNEVKVKKFCETVKIMADKVINLERDIYMDERFWHSWLCLYKREYLLKHYPQIKDSYKQFCNIVLKPFDWESYIYKAILIAQYVNDYVALDEYDRYYNLILNNLDIFNYIIKYEIFRNGKFLIDIMTIIDELNLSKVVKSKIKNRPDLARDERYGRRVIFEFNKSYPVVLGPMLEKDELTKYFLKFLGYYYTGEEVLDGIEDDEDEL